MYSVRDIFSCFFLIIDSIYLPNPSTRIGCDVANFFFKRSLTVWNSKFFLLQDWLPYLSQRHESYPPTVRPTGLKRFHTLNISLFLSNCRHNVSADPSSGHYRMNRIEFFFITFDFRHWATNSVFYDDNRYTTTPFSIKKIWSYLIQNSN